MNNASTPAERQQAHIRALLEEREACRRAGKKDRVKAINEELGEAAVEAEPPAKRAEARPAMGPRRSSR